jgi:PAS domain S-box-containing protein
MFKLLLSSIFTVVMVAGLTSVPMAGYNYHGYSMQMSEMSEMDSNDDGTITFDEERLESGNAFHGKTVNYRKDGSEFIMEWKIFPINNSENRTTHFLAVLRAV